MDAAPIAGRIFQYSSEVEPIGTVRAAGIRDHQLCPSAVRTWTRC